VVISVLESMHLHVVNVVLYLEEEIWGSWLKVNLTKIVLLYYTEYFNHYFKRYLKMQSGLLICFHSLWSDIFGLFDGKMTNAKLVHFDEFAFS